MSTALTTYHPAPLMQQEVNEKFEHIKQTYEALQRARAQMVREKTPAAAGAYCNLRIRLKQLRDTLPKLQLVVSR